ncbi:MAG: tetratricopeptide repeat protein [Gammaproteobacteria bacterium]|nr:tetratricopeptide repeat protein [Gammaproteobacteria bacterium]
MFGLKKGARNDGQLLAPLDTGAIQLEPGQDYLLEAVLRTLTLGHLFTEGTADSNQVWLEVQVHADGNLIGASGLLDPVSGAVDEWSHFVNAYVLDKNGRRIDRRNAEDIFTPLYNHQIPPGAADVVHYGFEVPEQATRIEITATLKYRKFDTRFFRLFIDDETAYNDLPITTIAQDKVILGVGPTTVDIAVPEGAVPLWQRWNDYGIGLLRKRGAGELRQAEQAFSQVATAGHATGHVNLARVFLREGRLDEAVTALRAATAHATPAPAWTVDYLSGLVNKQNGFLEAAVTDFTAVLTTQYNDARQRGFDFSKDYRVRNELAGVYFELARLERTAERAEARQALLDKAITEFNATLVIDPENMTAHYGLAQIYALTGDSAREKHHRDLHARYKPDDNARDAAISAARRHSAAANAAADAIVIYDLHRHVRANSGHGATVSQR